MNETKMASSSSSAVARDRWVGIVMKGPSGNEGRRYQESLSGDLFYLYRIGFANLKMINSFRFFCFQNSRRRKQTQDD